MTQLIKSTDLNPRYLAFTKEFQAMPNWAYMEFISNMKDLYADEYGLERGIVGGAHIRDHDGFTAFIVENAHLAGPIE